MALNTLQIQQLYVAYFGRPAENAGLAQWSNWGNAAPGNNQAAAAVLFAGSQEFHDQYGIPSGPLTWTFGTAYPVINTIYSNLFHRTASLPEMQAWGDLLVNGTKTIDQLVISVLLGALNSDLTAVTDKVDAATQYTNALATGPNATQQVLAYNGDMAVAAARAFLTSVYDNSTEAAALANLPKSIQALIDAHALTAGYTLTPGTDHHTDNFFNAPLAYTPGGFSYVNTLQDQDILVGSGVNPTLTATLGNIDGLNAGAVANVVTPHLTGIETLNFWFTGSFGGNKRVNTIDLQNSYGVKAVHIYGITDAGDDVTIKGFTAVPTDVSVADTSSPAGVVTFSTQDSAAAGASDATTVTVTNVDIRELRLNSGDTNKNGIEYVTLISKGDPPNTIGTFSDIDLTQFVIKGNEDLTIHDFEYGDKTKNQGKFYQIDGSQATGKLDLTLDSLDPAANATPYGTTGGDVAFTLTTGSGDDTIHSTVNFGSHQYVDPLDPTKGFQDIVDGNGGFNTLELSQSEEQSFTDNATYNNFQAVTVTRTTDFSDYEVETFTVDSDNITGNQTFFLVNKTNTHTVGATGIGVPTTNYVLNNLSSVEARQITIAHSGANAQSGTLTPGGATGGNGVQENVIFANLKTDTANDTVAVTIVDGTNSDPRFSFTLEATAGKAGKVENITIYDNDSESNTVQLDAVPADISGTVTLAGGVAGQFLNLDVNDNGLKGYTTSGGGYGLDVQKGLANDLAKLVATAKNTDVAVSAVYGKNSYQNSFISVSDPLVVLTASKIVATAEKSDVIVRVGAADQNIQLGTGNDTVIFSDRTGITKLSAGLTGADTVAGGKGFDTIVLDGVGTQTVADTEWQHLSGIDALRLAGQPGSVFNVVISNQFVGQTDSTNMLAIINNDGDISNHNENVANIDLRGLDMNHWVNFVGPNADGFAQNVQTVLVSQQSINGNDYLNGGDNNVKLDYTDIGKTGVHAFATQAASDAAWAANYTFGSNDGNFNELAIYNNAVVTVNDLVHVSNFHYITFNNSTTGAQTLNLTLDSATVDRLADASHTATDAQVEWLWITPHDSPTVTGAFSVLNLQAGSVGSQFSLGVDLSDADANGAYFNTVVTGDGNDHIIIGNSHGHNYITPGKGADTIDITNSNPLNPPASNDVIIYTKAGQTFDGVVKDGVTLLEPDATPSYSPLLGADIINLTGGLLPVGHPSVNLDLSALIGTSSVTVHNVNNTGNLVIGLFGTDDVYITNHGKYDTATHEFTANNLGTDALIQWDSNGSAAGGVVETVIVTGVGTDHVNSGTLLNGILHLTL